MIHFILIFLGSLLSLTVGAEESVSRLDKIIPREHITNQSCFECHGVSGFSIPLGEHGDSPKQVLHVDELKFGSSIHGNLQCLDCHSDIEQLPHTKEHLAKVDCVNCHQKLTATTPQVQLKGKAIKSHTATVEDSALKTNQLTNEYSDSIHAQASKAHPKQQNAECKQCHGTHYVFPTSDTRALTYRLSSPEMCGSCHEKALAEYRMSVHGAALKTPWKGESAVCSDCHSAHKISEVEGMNARRAITENCGNCHQQALASYMDTYHGQLAWLGGEKVAKCYDCHSPHHTKKITDPTDKVHPDNLLKTCQECHKNATPSFTQFQPHGNTHDRNKYPALWWVGKIMVGLVIGVLFFFYTHSMLWFYRSWQERQQPHLHHPELPHPKVPRYQEFRHFQRFSWGWRLNHWLLVISVMTLVFTGMTAMYADSTWAMQIVKLFGSPENAAIIHRVAAVGFLTAILGHVAAVLFKLWVLKKGRFEWFGPDSLLPRWKDASDMVAQFRWFFGWGEKPRFDRWTYWEKFDYWAVYWGALVIGASGIILWFSEFFALFLPGWVFNIATVAHGVEAFLAVTTLFVVHFFNNHFRPGKFPLDTVMFIGCWKLEELKEERPLEYERLVKSGELEKHLVQPPSKTAYFISYALGFTFITFGLFLLALVVIGLFEKGLI